MYNGETQLEAVEVPGLEHETPVTNVVTSTPPLPPVLFLAPPRWYGAHCAARSLGRFGVRVYMLRHSGISPSNLSRFCAGTFPAGDNGRPLGDPSEIVEDLLEAGRQLGRGTIVMAGTDEWAVFLAEHDEPLREIFQFPRQPPGLVATLASKRGLHDIATRHGFPTPGLVMPVDLHDALAAADSLVYPVMVKPAVSRPDVDTKVVASNPTQLKSAIHAVAVSVDNPNLILQEYIPGRDEDVWMFTGYFDAESRCLAAFTGQKLRQHPPHMGHTSLGICRTNRRLSELATTFMSDIGYSGIVDSGYKYDRRDDTYKVLDVNPRVGGNFRQFLDIGGIDVVRALYLDLTGQRVPKIEPREGRLWIKEDSDLISFVQSRRNRELDLFGWLRSIRGVDEGATFSWGDPLPFLSAMLMLVMDTVEGRWQRRWRARL